MYIKSRKSLLIYGYRNYISWLHEERVWRKEQEEKITKELAKIFGKKKVYNFNIKYTYRS